VLRLHDGPVRLSSPRTRWPNFRCGKPGSIVPLLSGFFLSGSCKGFEASLPRAGACLGSFPSQVTSFRAHGPRPCCNARGCNRRPGPIAPPAPRDVAGITTWKPGRTALLRTRRLSAATSAT